jgi:hypothetical protein
MHAWSQQANGYVLLIIYLHTKQILLFMKTENKNAKFYIEKALKFRKF